MYLTRTTTTTNQKGSTTNSNSYLKGKKVARSTNDKRAQEKSPYSRNLKQALYMPLDKWQECKPRQAALSRLQGNFRAQCCTRDRLHMSTGECWVVSAADRTPLSLATPQLPEHPVHKFAPNSLQLTLPTFFCHPQNSSTKDGIPILPLFFQ